MIYLATTIDYTTHFYRRSSDCINHFRMCMESCQN